MSADDRVSEEMCAERRGNLAQRFESAVAGLGSRMDIHFEQLKGVVEDIAHSTQAAHRRLDPIIVEMEVIKREALNRAQEQARGWPQWVTAVLLPVLIPLVVSALVGGLVYWAKSGGPGP